MSAHLFVSLSSLYVKSYTATRIAKNDNDQPKEDHNEEVASDDSSLSSVSTASGQSADNAERIPTKKTEFQHLISFIFRQIQSLYKLSALLMRPTTWDECIRSIVKNPDISLFINLDQDLIRERFPKASNFSICRMGLANTRRRQQLRYWAELLEEDNHSSQATAMPLGGDIELTRKNIAEAQPPVPQERLLPRKKYTQTLDVPSITTPSNFPKVALPNSEKFSGRSRTLYELCTQNGKRPLLFPKLLKNKYSSTYFSCPLCLAKLDSRIMLEGSSWR